MREADVAAKNAVVVGGVSDAAKLVVDDDASSSGRLKVLKN